MFTAKAKRLFAIILFLSTIFLNSCKKSGELVIEKYAYIRIVNASPGLGTYNVYANEQIMNSAAIPFGGTIAYKTFEPNTHTFKFTSASSTTSLFTKDISLKENEVSSYYLIGKPGQLDGLLVFDGNQDASLSEKAFIRFINLSPDAPALDLNVVGATSVTTNKSYKAYSTFAEVEAKKYSFEIKDTATGAVKATLTDVSFAAGRYYTIIARGLLNPGVNEQPFSAQSIIN